MGVIGAFLFQKFKTRKIEIKRYVFLILWIVFTTACLALVYGKIPMEKNPEKYKGSARDIIYMTLDRYVWSASILFVVFACETGGYILLYDIGYIFMLLFFLIFRRWIYSEYIELGFLGRYFEVELLYVFTSSCYYDGCIWESICCTMAF